jgi:dihydroorotate dehydrogenase electron transfer subunit
MMKRIDAQIVGNKKMTPHHFRMRVRSAYLARMAKPGQFVEVRCSAACEPLLRRPLGIHRIHADGIEMLYEVVGKGTDILSRKKPGEALDIIGPLGNGFAAGAGSRLPGSSIVVAGGIGVAPLMALATALRKKKRSTTVLIGARMKSHVLCAAEFKALGCAVIVTTDDGSQGRKGFVTDALKDLLRGEPVAHMYACGPTPMLKAVAAIAQEKNIPCQVSLEEHMACGVGVCLGCPVKVRKDLVDTEYKMVCKDGPVFDAAQIVW